MRTKLSIVSVFIGLIGFAASAVAAVPDLIPVQGVLTTAKGDAIDGNVDVHFALYDSETEDGGALWEEHYDGGKQLHVDQGLFTAYLGTINPLYFEDFISIGELWLGIAVGDDMEMGRVRLAAVPFAHEAQLCHQIGEFEADDIQPRVNIGGDAGLGLCAPGQVVQGIDPGTGTISCVKDQTATSSCGNVASVTGVDPIIVTEDGSGHATVEISIGDGAGDVAAGNHTHGGKYIPYLTCTSGYTLKYGASGWDCAADIDTNTTYTAGSGLTLAGTAFSVSFAGTGSAATVARSDHNHTSSYVASKTCTAGYVLKYGASGWDCAADIDTNTTYTAGTGLTLSSTQFNVTFAGTGLASTVARSDHNHDSSYMATKTCTSGSVLKYGASGWACATDNDTNTTYTAGTGLTLTGTVFSANTSVVQSRVGGSCSEGTAIRAIDSAGNVTCQGVAPLTPTKITSLNMGSATVGVNWTQINIGTRTFYKSRSSSSTKIELTFNSRIYTGTFAGGASAIQFQMRVNGSNPNVGEDYWSFTTSTHERVLFTNYFTSLGIGTHTVTLWARTNLGTSSSVLADSGGWNGSIMAVEY